MKYNFKEAQLPGDFCSERMHKVRNLLTPSGLFTIVGMPGVGLSFFLRFLATRDFAYFVYLDISSLAAPTKHEFYVALLKELGGLKIPSDEQEMLYACKRQIKKILKNKKRIIFLFNRFGELGHEMDKSLLSNLRTLRHSVADRISMIFASTQPMHILAPETMSGGNLDMFSNTYYFAPFGKEDFMKIFLLHSPKMDKKTIDELFVLAGGHYQIAKLFLKTTNKKDLFLDKLITISLKKLHDNLSYHQRKIIQKIAFNKMVESVDPELMNVGMVKKMSGKYILFSKIFTEYVKKHTSIKLPVKEAMLFRLLKKNMDRVVKKEEIFRALWSEDDEEFGSDWALNSLIYRLRKNPFFAAKGYIIESHKKVGYMLLRE